VTASESVELGKRAWAGIVLDVVKAFFAKIGLRVGAVEEATRRAANDPAHGNTTPGSTSLARFGQHAPYPSKLIQARRRHPCR
jgi:hypothetical protein